MRRRPATEYRGFPSGSPTRKVATIPGTRLARPQLLSRRQVETLEHLRLGLPLKEIAARLGLTYRTLTEYLLRLRRRLGAQNTLQIVAWWERHRREDGQSDCEDCPIYSRLIQIRKLTFGGLG